jgi:hypothetical protein
VETAIDQEHEDQATAPQLSAWLWKPWYAKLWWSAIPVWWAGMAVSSRVDFLEPFYRWWFAGYLNVLFFPMTALMVLGVGYVRERLDSFVGQDNGVPLSDEEAQPLAAKLHRDQLERMRKRARAHANSMDPRSGPLWIGNPMNPNNPGYINPNTGKHR